MALVMTPIYTQVIGAGGVSGITFNNIPQVFTDLKVVVSARQGGSQVSANAVLFLNGDTSLGSFTLLFGTGSTTGSGRATGYIDGLVTTAGTATASTFGSGELYIPNYTSSNFKSIVSDTVFETNATGADQQLRAALWRSTNAITTLGIAATVGNFQQHSTFSLYGIIRSGA